MYSLNHLELKAALQELGQYATDKPIFQLICDFEAEGRGYIGFDDFLHLFTEKVTNKDSRSDI
jgi:Ca2+-binding EF-hand superfamily protein